MSAGGPGLTALPLSRDVFGTPRLWAPAAEGASRPWDKGRDGFVLRPPHGRRLLPRCEDPSIGIYRPCQRVIARAGFLRSCLPPRWILLGGNNHVFDPNVFLGGAPRTLLPIPRECVPRHGHQGGLALMGEGAGVLVFEALEHALARGAPILAEYLGGAMTTDAYHMPGPCPLDVLHSVADRAFRKPIAPAGGGGSSPAGSQPAARLGSPIMRSLRKTPIQTQRNLNVATFSPFGCHALGIMHQEQVRRRIDVLGQGIQSVSPSDKIFTHFSDLETALAHTGQTYLHSGQSHFAYQEGGK